MGNYHDHNGNNAGQEGMLILTRKVDESIILGDDESKITVLGVKGNQARLGIRALKEISVHRDEVFKRLKAANES